VSFTAASSATSASGGVRKGPTIKKSKKQLRNEKYRQEAIKRRNTGK
jgi:hypothetical protein